MSRHSPVSEVLTAVDSILRPVPPLSVDGALALRRPHIGALLACLVVAGMTYGGVMGAFSTGGAPRPLQMAYSAIKVPLLLLATFALSLPSFFVLNTLAGLRRDFGEALRAVLTSQSGLAIILVSLAPVTGLWYLSVANYRAAILFNAAIFAVASFVAQGVLRRRYRPLLARDRRHRYMLAAWLVIYAFVGIQMGWVLRPFIGDAGLATAFLRSDSWGNAYVRVAEMAWSVFRGRG